MIQLLRNGSPIAHEHATCSILRICEQSANQQVVVDAGIMTELVTLCKTGSARAQELAAQVISELAKGAVVERDWEIARKQSEASESAQEEMELINLGKMKEN